MGLPALFVDMNRALRRFYMQKAKGRARRILDIWAERSNGRFDYDERKCGMMARTPVPCSCPSCGNPRRHFGQRTLQELRAEAPAPFDWIED